METFSKAALAEVGGRWYVDLSSEPPQSGSASDARVVWRGGCENGPGLPRSLLPWSTWSRSTVMAAEQGSRPRVFSKRTQHNKAGEPGTGEPACRSFSEDQTRCPTPAERLEASSSMSQENPLQEGIFPIRRRSGPSSGDHPAAKCSNEAGPSRLELLGAGTPAHRAVLPVRRRQPPSPRSPGASIVLQARILSPAPRQSRQVRRRGFDVHPGSVSTSAPESAGQSPTS